MGGKRIKTRVNFEQESFVYQGWPVEFSEDSENEGEEEGLIPGRPAEDGLEEQIVAEPLVEENAIEIQVDHEKEEQIMAKAPQRDKQEKVLIGPQENDGQEQVSIEPAPVHQGDCEVIEKIQHDHQESQKEVNSGMEGASSAINTVETFEPPLTPQALQKRKKLSRMLRKLRC